MSILLIIWSMPLLRRVVTFTGQNYGAKDEGRCKKIFSSWNVVQCDLLWNP